MRRIDRTGYCLNPEKFLFNYSGFLSQSVSEILRQGLLLIRDRLFFRPVSCRRKGH